MNSDFKRRKYPVIFRERQYRLLAQVLFYSFTLVAIFFVFLFLPDFIQMQDETASLELRGYAADRVLMLHARLWPAILAAICLIGLHSFRVFLFFVGPLKRLQWAFKKVTAGDLDFKVSLREGDFLVEEGDIFNQTIGTLSGRVNRVKAAVESAGTALKALTDEANSLPQESRVRVAGLLETLEVRIDDVRRGCDYFKTGIQVEGSSPESKSIERKL